MSPVARGLLEYGKLFYGVMNRSRYLFQSHGRIWVWRKLVERFYSDCGVVATVKCAGRYTLLYDCFLRLRLGQLLSIHGTMNADIYFDVLDKLTQSELWQNYCDDGPFFQQA